MTGWTEIELWRADAGSWRRYRYSDERRATGRPVHIELFKENCWWPCPNVDVADSIMKLAGLGR